MQETIFTKIIQREIPAEVIYEDAHVIVIPDKFPSMEGQVLVITKEPAPYLFDLAPDTYRALMDATRTVARALDSAYGTVRTCVVVEGFEVPHVHVRLYPCTDETLTLEPRTEASDAELARTAQRVRAALV